MSEQIKNIALRYWPQIVFGLLAIILPFVWLKPGYLWVPEEALFINYQMVIEKNLYSWLSHINGGIPALVGGDTNLIPNGIFYYIFSLFNVATTLIQRLFLTFVISFLFFSIYKFLELFSKKKLVIFLGSLFYFLNFYTGSIFFHSAKMYQMILTPLMFLLLYKYLKYHEVKYCIFNFFVFFLFQAIFCNLPQLIITLAIYAFAIAYYLMGEKIISIKEITKKASVFFVFLIPIFFYQFLIYYLTFYQKFHTMKEISTFTALRSPLYLLFQLRGSWWEYLGWKGISYNRWLHFYDSPLVIIVSFLLIVICFSGFFSREIKKRIVVFWAIIFLLSLSLAKGISSPFGSIYNWAFHNVPFFYIFREPWAKFTPLVVLSLSVLLCLSLDIIRRKKIVFTILILLLIKGIPFFSPNFFDHPNWGPGTGFACDIKIPNYWYKFSNWTKNHSEKALFILPVIKNSDGIYQYEWYNKNIAGNAKLPLYYFLAYTNNFYTTSRAFGLFSKVSDLISLVNNDTNIRILSLFNIDYFLEQKDVNTEDKKITIAVEDLKKNSFIVNKPCNSFGKLDLYKISDEYFLPHIYSSTSPTVVESDIEALVPMSYTKYLDGKPVLLFTEQTKGDIGILGNWKRKLGNWKRNANLVFRVR